MKKIKNVFKLHNLGIFCAFAILFGVIGCTAVGAIDTVRVVAKDGDDAADSTSFADMSQAAAEYLSYSISPDNKDHKVKKLPIADAKHDWANTGSVVGYIEQGSEFAWLTSWLTTASSSTGYSTYAGLTDDNGNQNDTVLRYVEYGAMLNALGLDSTGTESAGKLTRALGGWSMYALYTLSGFIPAMFQVAIKALKTLNPFQVFSVSGITNIIKPLSGSDTSSPMYSLGVAMADFYSTLAEYGWTICAPIFLGGLILELYLFHKTKPSSAVKKFIIRICAIGMGIPLLGATYTEILNMMDHSLDSSNSASTQVVSSIFVDFQDWAEKYRLDWLPDTSAGIYADPSSGTLKPYDGTYYSIRTYCYEINSKVNDGLGISSSDVYGASDVPSALKWNTNLYASNHVQSKSAFQACQGMLKSYAQASTYTAADWETKVKSWVSQQPDDTVVNYGNLFKTTSTKDGFQGSSKTMVNATVGSGDDYGIDASVGNPWGNGHMTCSSDGSGADKHFKYSNDLTVDLGGKGYQIDKQGGLSTMSLYNYLNTGFNNGNLVLYSLSESTSLFTREQHYSVNMVGNGFMALMYWLNAATLLISFIVIGFVYALGMIFYVISRSIRMLTSIPGMLLGSVKAFGKVIVYTISMIVQVLVTLIMYEVVTAMLFQVNTVITVPLSNTLGDVGSTLMVGSTAIPATAGTALLDGLLLLGSVAQLLFSFFAIKERRTVLKGFNEATEQVISKLLDTNASVDNSASLAQKAAGGIAGAAGMAYAANHAAGNKSDKNAEKGDTLEDTKGADGSVGTGGSDETPDATGSGGDNDGTGNGIEGDTSDEAKKLETDKDSDKEHDKLEDKHSGESNEEGSDGDSGEDGHDGESEDGSDGESSEDGEASGPATDEEIAAEAENADSLSEMSDTSDSSDADSDSSSTGSGESAGGKSSTGKTGKTVGGASKSGDGKSSSGKDVASGETAGKTADTGDGKSGKDSASSAVEQARARNAQLAAEVSQSKSAADASQAGRDAKKAAVASKLSAAGEAVSSGAQTAATAAKEGVQAAQAAHAEHKEAFRSSAMGKAVNAGMSSMVAAGVATVLGADEQSVQMAQGMAMMGTMSANGGMNGGGQSSSSASAPATASGASAGPAPVSAGGGGSQIARTAPAGPSAGAKAGGAMPGGPVVSGKAAGGPVMNTSGGGMAPASAGASAPTSVNVPTGGGSRGSAVPTSATPRQSSSSAGVPTGGSLSSGYSGGVGFNEGSAAEAAELARLDQEYADMLREKARYERSQSVVGRIQNSFADAGDTLSATGRAIGNTVANTPENLQAAKANAINAGRNAGAAVKSGVSKAGSTAGVAIGKGFAAVDRGMDRLETVNNQLQGASNMRQEAREAQKRANQQTSRARELARKEKRIEKAQPKDTFIG